MLKYIVVVSVLLAVGLGFSQSAFAVTAKTDEDRSRESRIAAIAASLRDQRMELETGEWNMPQLEQYLNTAMWYIYYGKVYADTRFNDDTRTTNDDLTQLVNLGYLPFWPDNPLRDWKPMQVLRPGDAFCEGDLVFALCPASHYSRTLSGLMPVSFDLFIYGPVIDYTTFGQFSLDSTNAEWSTTPAGAMYGVSFYMQSEAKRLENQRKWEEQQAKKAQESGS